MNLVWHIVKKDLRALRWPLVVWVALIAAKLVMGVLLLTTDTGEKELFTTLDALVKMLAGLECFGVVLVAALIQEDMLVGTTAFWTTRPISGGRLLAAKLLGLGLIFVVLPVLVTLPWWLGCHLGAGAMLGAALETAGLHLLVVLVGLWCAVVTDGLGRFMLWLLALLASIPLLGATIAFWLQRMNAIVPSELATTRLTVGAGVALFGVAAVVGHQFLTRRVWRSVAMIGATLGVVVAVQLAWPWSWHINAQWNRFLVRQAEQAWPVGAEPPGLTFVARGAEIRRGADGRRDRPAQLWVNCRVEGVPSGQMLVPGVNSYTLRWADGVGDDGWSWFRFLGEFPLLVTQPKTGGPAAESTLPVYFRATQTISAKLAARLEDEPAVYTLKTRFSLLEAGATERLPSAPGKRIMFGAAGERVAAVEKDGEQLLVTVVRSRPALISDYLAQLGNYVLGAGQGGGAPARYFLMNHDGKTLDEGQITQVRTSRVAAVEVSWETATYRAMKPESAAKPRWEAIKALEEAELARVTYHYRGSFAHTIKVDSLAVTAPASN